MLILLFNYLFINQLQADKNVELKYSDHEHGFDAVKNSWLFVDQPKFVMIFRNLVSRAIDVSSNGQSVDIYFFLKDIVEPINQSNSIRTQRRATASTRSNRVAVDDRLQYETEFERQLREEEEREMERERQMQPSPKQILRIEIHDSGPALNEVSLFQNNFIVK